MPVLAGPVAPALPEFPTDLPTRAYLGDSGIVLDGDRQHVLDPEGCWWSLHTDPWGEVAPREQSGDRAAGHGQYDATRYFGPRDIALTGLCHAPNHAALHSARWRLRHAASLTPFRYRVTEPGFDGWLMARQQTSPQWTEHGTTATYTLTLRAPLPEIHSSLERSFGPLRFPITSGGLQWAPSVSWGPSASWDAEVVSGRELLANPGNQPVGLQLRADGPAQSLAISLIGLGQTLHLEDPDGAPILRAGEWLSVDTATHEVLLMGDSGRRGWVWGDWLKLPALSESEVAITGTGVDMTLSGVSGEYRADRI